MGPGPVGQVIMFVLTLAGSVMIGIAVAAYAAHCFLLIVQETAAGNDEVRWPNEPFYDWLWKGPYLVWLAGVWLFPAVLLLRILNPPSPTIAPGLWFAVVVVATLWLMFPISLLSSLSGGSRWAVLRSSVLWRLSKRAAPVIHFYGASGVVLVGGGAALYKALLSGESWLFLGGLAGATALFIYARLLGRITWIVGKVREAAPKKPRKEKRLVLPGDAPRSPPRPLRPRKRKPIRTPEGLVEGYGIAADEPQQVEPEPAAEPEPRGPILTPEGPVDGYELSGEELSPRAEEERSAHLASVLAASEREMELERRRDVPPLPRMPLVSGVYSFPWYPDCLPHWALLSVAFLVFLGVLGLLISLWPV
jgi:hypothetical protein